MSEEIIGKKVKLLSDEDIYDVYGCQSLLKKSVGDDDIAEVKARIYQIQEMYVTAAKARIKSEARFCGLDVEDGSLTFMLSKVRELIGKEVEQQQMMSGGRPINLMATILKAHRAAGADLTGINLGQYGVEEVKEPEKPKCSEIDPDWFTAKGQKKGGGPMWENKKWAEIARAFVKIEEATDPADICVKIDRINCLQHNSFHVLIDLQTGRMLEGRSTGDKYQKDADARKALQDVLDIAKGEHEPIEFADKMSEEIRKLMHKYQGHIEHRATAAEAKKIRK